ncbi:MAG TPA: hypothetical protein V6D35_23610 [Candidatus Sericytochromatia bacterium]
MSVRRKASLGAIARPQQGILYPSSKSWAIRRTGHGHYSAYRAFYRGRIYRIYPRYRQLSGMRAIAYGLMQFSLLKKILFPSVLG